MPIHFNVAVDKKYGNFTNFRYANRRAARRQTEEQREKIFAKYQALVGTTFRNMGAARRAAQAELRQLPEYWDEDTTPRRELNIASSCFARIVPSAGGVFIYFRSNPEKGYYYPAAGTKEGTARQVEKLVTAPSLGQAYWHSWRKRNAAPKVIGKDGSSYYRLKGGKAMDLTSTKKGSINWYANRYRPKTSL